MASQKKSSGAESEFEELRHEVESLRVEQREIVKRARDLEKRNLQLAELNQSKDEFIAIASHQLRTPATAVKQYIGLLLEGYAESLEPGQALFLQKAHESNDRQLQIIDDLLQVARIDSSSFSLAAKKDDITKLLSETVNELRKKAEARRQKIIFIAPKTKIETTVDTPRFRMVIENLVENAIHYSPKGKTITVRLRSGREWVSISVEDQGVGISPHDSSRLFQKFSRIPNPLSVEVGGTGLGLYWADRIVKLHGGSITVRSAAGKGSTFIVKIPR